MEVRKPLSIWGYAGQFFYYVQNPWWIHRGIPYIYRVKIHYTFTLSFRYRYIHAYIQASNKQNKTKQNKQANKQTNRQKKKRAYIHAHMHTCTHAYMHTCMHTCIHANMHTCIHAYIHACIHAYLHMYILVYIYMIFSVYSAISGNILHATGVYHGYCRRSNWGSLSGFLLLVVVQLYFISHSALFIFLYPHVLVSKNPHIGW